MTKANYVNEVVAEVKALGDYEVKATDVVKNNNIRMTGIVINNGNNISPTIYVDEMFENGLSATEAAREVIRMYNANVNVNINVDDLTDMIRNKERLLENVKPKLVNANQDEEIITYPFLDMKIAFYVEVKGVGSGKSTVTIRKQHTTATEKELFNAALKNIPETEFMTMGEMLTEMMGGVPFPCDESMYVVTSKDKMFGAINILDGATMREIARKLNDDVIILPSSIHEVICVPAATGEGNPMAQLVREVNATQVAPNEVLSDNVYLYRRTSDSFEIKEV